MEDLITLVNLFQKTKFKSAGMLGIILEPNSQLERLYDAIANGSVQSDEDAKSVFPEYAKDPGKLHTVKSKLKDRLHDSVLLLDFKEASFNDRQKAFFECSKKWSAAMILLSKNARHNAIGILDHLLKYTLQFEFTELTLEILRTLRLHFGVLIGDQKKYQELEAQIEYHEEVWIMERKTEGAYAELITCYVRKNASPETISQKAKEFYEQVKPFMAHTETYKVQLFGRLLEILIYDSVHDYENTARKCEEALAFFAAKKYNSGIALQVFNYNLFVCYLNLKQYEKCSTLADQNKELFEDGSFNWFKLQELYFLNALHSGHYDKAVEICQTTLKNAGYSKQPPSITELWKIFEGYLHFMDEAQYLPGGIPGGKFKIAKLLNEIPYYSKDKGGMNVTVQILQYIYDLAEGRWDMIVDRVEGLAKYRTRYIDAQTAHRSHYFVRMLEQIPKSAFNLNDLAKKTGPLLQTMSNTPVEAANQMYEMEIVPYEVLWQMVTKVLEIKQQPSYTDLKQETGKNQQGHIPQNRTSGTNRPRKSSH